MYMLQRDVGRAQSEDLFHNVQITFLPQRAWARHLNVPWMIAGTSSNTTLLPLADIRGCMLHKVGVTATLGDLHRGS